MNWEFNALHAICYMSYKVTLRFELWLNWSHGHTNGNGNHHIECTQNENLNTDFIYLAYGISIHTTLLNYSLIPKLWMYAIECGHACTGIE